MDNKISFGLPRMHKEVGERRDFLPNFVGGLQNLGVDVALEHYYGIGMGFAKEDYLEAAPEISFVSHEETYKRDYVIELRCPSDDEIRSMRPGACLISMLHYPTRPQRVEFLRAQGLEAISLDSLKDDSGRRLVENMRAVAWNGVEAAFQTLRDTYPAPGFDNPNRLSIQVTLLGAGAVGSHVVQAAVRYGDPKLQRQMAEAGVPGVQVKVVDYDLTCHERTMWEILSRTDILIDATQRANPSQLVIPNDWIAYLPEHAVIVDLSVDPYDCSSEPVQVKGIEGTPQGNLDQYIFAPNDPAYDRIPNCINTKNRRHAISCYSWPGIRPQECMEIYGGQLLPILRTLIDKGGAQNIDPRGRFFERVIARAQLSRWTGD